MSEIRRIILIIALTVFTVLGTVNVSAGEINENDEKTGDMFLLDFSRETAPVDKANVEITFENGALHAVLSADASGEPACIFDISGIDTVKYPVMKIKLKNRSQCEMFRFGFGNGEIPRSSDTIVNIKPNDSGYSTYIINVAEANEETLPLSAAFYPEIGRPARSAWTEPVDRLCLNFWFSGYGSSDFGESPEMDIAYIGFFENEEKAGAFDIDTGGDKPFSSKVILIAGVAVVLILLIVLYGSASGDSKKNSKKKNSSKSSGSSEKSKNTGKSKKAKDSKGSKEPSGRKNKC